MPSRAPSRSRICAAASPPVIAPMTAAIPSASRHHWCREIDLLPSMATHLQGSAPAGFPRSKIAPVAGPAAQHIKSSPPCCSSCSRLQNFRNGWRFKRRFDEPPPFRYHACAGWSSLVARRAHNPKVVGSNPTPATKFTDSQGLVGRNQQALLLSGKDLGKKSVFPYQSRAIRFRKSPLASPQHRARLV